jgi:hypothetical protein
MKTSEQDFLQRYWDVIPSNQWEDFIINMETYGRQKFESGKAKGKIEAKKEGITEMAKACENAKVQLPRDGGHVDKESIREIRDELISKL